MDRSNVRLTDRQLTDTGFAMIPNYWLRFWRPALGLIPAALWEQLLAYTRPPDDECHPSISTLAEALGCDRRHLIGRQRPGKPPEPGAIALLQQHRLIRAERDPAGNWSFWVRRDPGLLPDDLIMSLPYPAQRAHAAWLERWEPYMRSMACATPEANATACSMAPAAPPVAYATPPMAHATQTEELPIPNNRQENPRDATDRLVLIQPSPALAQLWATTLADLRTAVPPVVHDTYLLPARLIALDESSALVQVTTNTAAAQLRRCEPSISRALSAIVSRPVTIEYRPGA